jgi:hypothetical protein
VSLRLVPQPVDPWTPRRGVVAVAFIELAARNWMRLNRPEKAAETLGVGLDYLTAAYADRWLP